MTDNRICAATPRQSLEDQILNENEPKNEREWWACRHIKYLRDEVIAERNVDIEQLRQRVTEKDEVIAEAGEMLAMRDRQLAAIKTENATAWAQAHRLALELECLLLDTKDNAIVSKWWDSGMEALSEYQQLKPGAAEEAEAWAKMRKEML